MSVPVRRRDEQTAASLRPPQDETPTVKVGVRREAEPAGRRPRSRAEEETQRLPLRGRPEDVAPGMPTIEQPIIELPVHERLLQAARERFSTDGYENATTAAIARQAGTSESQLVKHFGSKEGLLEAIFDEAWSRLELAAQESLDEKASPAARLLSLSDAVIRNLERDRKMRSLLLLEGRRIRKNGHEVVISTGFRRFLALVDALFSEMQEEGEVRADVHLEAARSAWIGAIEGLLRDQLLSELMGYPASFNKKAVRRTSIEILATFLTPRAQRMVHARAG